MARLTKEPYSLPEATTYRADDPHMAAFDALVKASEDIDPEGDLTGTLVQWPRGDGFAAYLVTQTKPLTLQHVPFLDAWTVEAALIRGLRIDDVRQHARFARRRAELFRR